MKCTDPSEIYLFLEDALSEKKKTEIKSHIAFCQKCRLSLEKRERMLRAIHKIPPYKAPPGFSKKVMTNIHPIHSTLSDWLKAGAAALAFIFILSFLFLTFTNQGLTEFLVKLFQSLIQSSQEMLVASIKVIKILSVFINISIQLIGLIIKSILSVIPTVSTEIQVITVLFGILIAVMILLSLKQKFILGDKE